LDDHRDVDRLRVNPAKRAAFREAGKGGVTVRSEVLRCPAQINERSCSIFVTDPRPNES
jgi:hypothetical protein